MGAILLAGLSQAHQMDFAQTETNNVFVASVETKLKMTNYVFANLKHWMETGGDTLVAPPEFNDLGAFPVYITWKKWWTNEALEEPETEAVLRGCQGTLLFGDFEANLFPLGYTLRQMSIISAAFDNRFFPIQLEELENLMVEISVLNNFEPISDPYDWDIETHGLTLSITADEQLYQSTYLPRVALEGGMTMEETLDNLVKKAGYSGCFEDVKDNVEMTRYQSVKFGMDYYDWENPEWGWRVCYYK